jgi:protocatechuate 3,4-dioxygenase beta subunit
MRLISLSLMSLFLLLCPAATAVGQSRESKPAPATGSISGRVMVGEDPAPGVTLALTSRRMRNMGGSPLAQAVTDAEGRFQLNGIAAGTYLILPLAPGFVVPKEGVFYDEGKSVTIDEGESVDNVNFSIKRGGVLTGRVTDENREPLVETRINLLKLDEQGRAQPHYVRNPFISLTDDRGIYRIYGLPAGRYKVSVGEQANSVAISLGRGNSPHQRTFHPDTPDETRAEIIELSDGGEAINVDISVNAKIKTYRATGRLVSATTGKPIGNVQYAYGVVSRFGDGPPYMEAVGWTGNRTNSKGEFRLEGIVPGQYAVFIVKEENVELYAPPTVFEVKDADVGNLEIKARTGISLSGVAVLEGKVNAALLSVLSRVYLSTQITPQVLEPGFGNPARISADGSFRFTGLRPGRAQLYAGSPQDAMNLTLLRIEHNGVEVKDGIELKEGEPVTDVRLVFAQGTSSIRGQVKVEDGELPAGLRLMISLRRVGNSGTGVSLRTPPEVDGRGRFVIDELTAGEYEVTIHPQYMGPAPPGSPPIMPMKQTVKVADGAEVQVNFILNTGEKKERQ